MAKKKAVDEARLKESAKALGLKIEEYSEPVFRVSTVNPKTKKKRFIGIVTSSGDVISNQKEHWDWETEDPIRRLLMFHEQLCVTTRISLNSKRVTDTILELFICAIKAYAAQALDEIIEQEEEKTLGIKIIRVTGNVGSKYQCVGGQKEVSLTPEQFERLGEALKGTKDDVAVVAKRLFKYAQEDYTEEERGGLMSFGGVYRCHKCGLWSDADDLDIEVYQAIRLGKRNGFCKEHEDE